MEFTIAMVITSLVVGFGYQALALFSGRSAHQRDTTDEVEEWAAFESTLSTDFKRAAYVEADENSILCFQENKQVRYNWLETSIVREIEMAADTFHFSTENYNYAFAEIETETGWIDALTLQVKCKEKMFVMSCQKTYDALYLMQYDSNTGNWTQNTAAQKWNPIG